MVATSQRHATEAGLAVLGRGGNAADAAVAVAAALAVTEPTSTGLGGDCFALYYEADTGRITALNGAGRAPAGLSLDRLAREGFRGALPVRHGHTITVPGAVAGWADLLARHGSMGLSAVLSPAIALAEEGFEVAPITAHFWARALPGLLAAPGGVELTIDGCAPAAGQPFRNVSLARTLEAIAAGGAGAFYEGEIARDIADAAAAAGGALAAEDLASHRSTWDEPLSVPYRGHRIWECPPSGQGLTALLALRILDGLDDLSALAPLGADRLHLITEALRLAFSDARWYVADPAFFEAPIEELLSEDFAARRRALLDRGRRIAVARGAPVASSGTVQFCVVDARGNACSFVNSNYMGFGTGVVPRGRGFSLQNRGHGFSLDPDHPNKLAPKKRPYHTIIPGMITRSDGSLYGPFGVMGGFMQPQGHVQVVIAMLDDGASPQAALDRPRICLEPAEGDGALLCEAGISDAATAELARRGHPVKSAISGFERAVFGRGQIIRRGASGTLEGGSDERADGCALSD